MTHDRLQFECHTWLWNRFPELRYLSHANFNDIKLVLNFVKIPQKTQQIIGSRMKSLGMVKGVLDYQFLYQNKLYAFDFKVGDDKLSKEQKEFIKQLKNHGGEAYEVRSLEQFKLIILGILKQNS
jgi:hypothetical protein